MKIRSFSLASRVIEAVNMFIDAVSPAVKYFVLRSALFAIAPHMQYRLKHIFQLLPTIFIFLFPSDYFFPLPVRNNGRSVCTH